MCEQKLRLETERKTEIKPKNKSMGQRTHGVISEHIERRRISHTCSVPPQYDIFKAKYFDYLKFNTLRESITRGIL